MRPIVLAAYVVLAGMTISMVAPADKAQAKCRTWTATHNGTNLIYPNQGGAAGTAANKLIWQVEQWQKEKGIKRVRIGKIRTKCGDWFMKYLLPHKNCVATASVCY